MKQFLLIITCLLMTFSHTIRAERMSFSSTEKAADTLYQAIKTKDSKQIDQLFGTENSYLLYFDEVDSQDIEQFITAWDIAHKIIIEDEQYHYIEIGSNQWTFPIPIIKKGDKWIFDIITGSENINIRRTGRNELATMQTVLAYYDAQLEYATIDRNANGVLEYAQKFISTEGKKDGLFWPTKAEETLSPLGSLLDNKTPKNAYHGYYYKILKSQGNYAIGGTLNYIIDGQMTAGFALIAWPSEYGRSGVMSFMVNKEGVIYEKDLGYETQKKGNWIKQFDPNSSWTRLQ